MSTIPVHKLQDKTNFGFQLKAFNSVESNGEKLKTLGAHRDDHYLFFLINSGMGSMLVDFDEITVVANQLFYILPQQIHYHIQTIGANGWFMAVDPSLVDSECRLVLESGLGIVQPLQLTPYDALDYNSLLQLIDRKLAFSSEGGVTITVLHALLHAFLSMAAVTIRAGFMVDERSSRPAELAKAFRQLLTVHIKIYRSPSDYARLLHVSESYLNECLKKMTGSPVSFWIKYHVILEAKRHLYFSNLTVKQVANELGFDDQSYFSRFFRQETGMTALTFRKQFRHSTVALAQ